MYVEIISVQLELICVPERRNGDDFGRRKYRIGLSVLMGIIEGGRRP